MMFEAIIVGGSYAGLSAALQLARARRSILVVDGGKSPQPLCRDVARISRAGRTCAWRHSGGMPAHS